MNKLLCVKIFFLVLMFVSCTSSYSQELICNNTKVEYQLGDSSAYGYESISARIFQSRSELTSKFSFEWMHFSIICFSNINNEKFIVYKAYCGGSGCDDSSNYGIIDTNTGMSLLKPYPGNRKEAERILKNLPLELD